jgi:hypothetical protein
MSPTRLPLQAQLEGAVPATDNLDVLGLDPQAPLPTVTQPPPPPLPLALFDADVPCSVQQLFRIVMGPDAAFIRTQHATHKYWDVSISEWAKCAGERTDTCRRWLYNLCESAIIRQGQQSTS